MRRRERRIGALALLLAVCACAGDAAAQVLPPCALLFTDGIDRCSTYCRMRGAPQYLVGEDICSCGEDDVFVSVCTTDISRLTDADVQEFFDASTVGIPVCSAVGISDQEACADICSRTAWNTRSTYAIEQAQWTCVCENRNTALAVCGDPTYSSNTAFEDTDDDVFFQLIPSVDLLTQELLQGSTPQCESVVQQVVTNELLVCFEQVLQEASQVIDFSNQLAESDVSGCVSAFVLVLVCF